MDGLHIAYMQTSFVLLPGGKAHQRCRGMKRWWSMYGLKVTTQQWAWVLTVPYADTSYKCMYTDTCIHIYNGNFCPKYNVNSERWNRIDVADSNIFGTKLWWWWYITGNFFFFIRKSTYSKRLLLKEGYTGTSNYKQAYINIHICFNWVICTCF